MQSIILFLSRHQFFLKQISLTALSGVLSFFRISPDKWFVYSDRARRDEDGKGTSRVNDAVMDKIDNLENRVKIVIWKTPYTRFKHSFRGTSYIAGFWSLRSIRVSGRICRMGDVRVNLARSRLQFFSSNIYDTSPQSPVRIFWRHELEYIHEKSIHVGLCSWM